MKKLIQFYCAKVQLLRDLPPLFFRLILAYGFYGTATKKIANIGDVIDWFTSLGYPFPAVNAYLAAGTESVGVVLLTLGLATRFISAPLMFVMVVAIATVHWENGFSAGDNGYEIPLYFFLMLFSLVTTGGGRISLDYLISRRFSRN